MNSSILLRPVCEESLKNQIMVCVSFHTVHGKEYLTDCLCKVQFMCGIPVECHEM